MNRGTALEVVLLRRGTHENYGEIVGRGKGGQVADGGEDVDEEAGLVHGSATSDAGTGEEICAAPRD